MNAEENSQCGKSHLNQCISELRKQTNVLRELALSTQSTLLIMQNRRGS